MTDKTPEEAVIEAARHLHEVTAEDGYNGPRQFGALMTLKQRLAELDASRQPKGVRPEEVPVGRFTFVAGRLGEFQMVRYLGKRLWIDTNGAAYDFAPSDRLIPLKDA